MLLFVAVGVDVQSVHFGNIRVRIVSVNTEGVSQTLEWVEIW